MKIKSLLATLFIGLFILVMFGRCNSAANDIEDYGKIKPHYDTFHMKAEPDTTHAYNKLSAVCQQEKN